jgi:hypothetical protein
LMTDGGENRCRANRTMSLYVCEAKDRHLFFF